MRSLWDTPRKINIYPNAALATNFLFLPRLGPICKSFTPSRWIAVLSWGQKRKRSRTYGKLHPEGRMAHFHHHKHVMDGSHHLDAQDHHHHRHFMHHVDAPQDTQTRADKHGPPGPVARTKIHPTPVQCHLRAALAFAQACEHGCALLQNTQTQL